MLNLNLEDRFDFKELTPWYMIALLIAPKPLDWILPCSKPPILQCIQEVS